MATCDVSGCGTGGWTGPLPGDPDNILSISAAAAFGGIDVTWSYPGVNPHAVAHVQLFRALVNDFAQSAQIALVAGTFFHDRIDAGITYYYWLRVVSINGTLGDPIGPASATSRPLIGDLIEQLTGEIDAGVLAESLKGRLDEISLLNENLAAEIFDRESGQTSFAAALLAVEDGVAEAHTFIADEITSRVTANSAIIEQIELVAAVAGDQVAEALVTTQAWVDAVDLKAGALWSAKLTVNNLVGGFGIYNDGSLVEAGFDVDTFWVGRTAANKRKPFIVVGAETFIDQAVINELTFTKLKDAAGTVIVADGKIKTDYLETKGLLIKDAGGTVLFGAGYPITWSAVSSKPAFKDMALIDKLTAANITTYIDGAAIGTALIGDAVITSAKIGSLEVGTSNIGLSAVSAAYSASSAGTSTSVSVVIPANTASAMILATGGTSHTVVGGGAPDDVFVNPVSITIGGSTVRSGYGTIMHVEHSPAAGTYTVGVTRTNLGTTADDDTTIVVLVSKR